MSQDSQQIDVETVAFGEPYPVPGFDATRALRVDRQEAVARVTLLGPGKGNVMGQDLWNELPAAFHALDADEEVRAVVLTGSGRNFGYGLDLGAAAASWGERLGADDGLARARTWLHGEVKRLQGALDSVAACRKPVAAAIQGWCIGGHVDLISACDVRYASSDARFSIREVRAAIVADLGSLQRLPGIIGEGHLRELALTGKDITADRAEKIGLVNDVALDKPSVIALAHDFADAVAANPPLVVQGTKQVLDAVRADDIAAGLRYVAAWNSAFLPSRDLGESFAAHLQKRPPNFTGR